MKIQNQLNRQGSGARALRMSLIPLCVAAALVSRANAQIDFSYAGGFQIGNLGVSVSGPILGDFDGDGDRDVAFASYNPTYGGSSFYAIHNDNGHFQGGGGASFAIWSGADGLTAGDFDGDGNLDVAVTLTNVNGVQLVRGQGRYFRFTLGGVVDSGGLEPREISAADMDGDGDPDLVVSNHASSQVSVLRNDGGGFTLVGAFAMGNGAGAHTISDFDGDGDWDVAVMSRGTGEVALLMNDGTGALGAPSFLGMPAATSPQDLAAADMDNDGDIDLVCGAGNAVVIFRNDGAGAFSGPSGTYGLGTGALFVADLDSDADNDVVGVNLGLSVLVNNGGVLTPVVGGHSFLGVASGVVGCDLNYDGMTDLVVMQRQAPWVHFYHNEGSTSFLGTNYCTANVNSTGLAAHMSASGNTWIPANDFRLECTQMPHDAWGYFLTSTTQGFTANPGGSEGNLCLGGAIGRYSKKVRNSGDLGTIALLVEFSALPTPTGLVIGNAGETWNFQCWFRDRNAAGTTSNLSDGMTVTLR